MSASLSLSKLVFPVQAPRASTLCSLCRQCHRADDVYMARTHPFMGIHPGPFFPFLAKCSDADTASTLAVGALFPNFVVSLSLLGAGADRWLLLCKMLYFREAFLDDCTL